MYRLTPLILILACQFTHADIGLPIYTDLERLAERDLQDINDPTEDPEFVEVLREATKIRMALLHLMEGKIGRFQDLALSLPDIRSEMANDPYFQKDIAALMHYTVEADIAIADYELIELFGRVVKGLDSNTTVSDESRTLYRASYFFLRGDTGRLLKIAESAAKEISSGDRYFVCGYTSLLLGRLTLDSAALSQSASCFEEISTEQDHEEMFGVNPSLGGSVRNAHDLRIHRLSVGRAALHRATALRLLADGTSDYESRRKNIHAAAKAATQARCNIDLIDNPLMWGAAYRVTSEVLDSLYSIESVESSGRSIAEIAQRRDRAYQLSTTYR